jgi:hypothetical protein
MAGKTQGELIGELQTQVGDLKTQLAVTKELLDRVDMLALLDRITRLETEVKELNRRKEEAERGNRQLLYIVIGAALTILAQLLVNLALIPLKK